MSATHAKLVGNINMVHLRGHDVQDASDRQIMVTDRQLAGLVKLVLGGEDQHSIYMSQGAYKLFQRLDDNALLAIQEQIDGYFERKQAAEAGWLDSKNLNALAAGD